MDYITIINNLEARGDPLTINAAKAIRALLKEQNKYKTERQLGPLRIDFEQKRIELNGEYWHLPPLELKIFLVLAKTKNMVTKESVYISLYGYDGEPDESILLVTISKLRKRLLKVLGYDCITTFYGRGWQLVENKES